jgi:hypothetical protein
VVQTRERAVSADGGARIKVDRGAQQEVANQGEHERACRQPDLPQKHEDAQLAPAHLLGLGVVGELRGERRVELVEADRDQAGAGDADEELPARPSEYSRGCLAGLGGPVAGASGKDPHGDKEEAEVDDGTPEIADAVREVTSAAALRAATGDSLPQLPQRVGKQAYGDDDQSDAAQPGAGQQHE